MTTTEPDNSYPPAWRPKGLPEPELEMSAVEVWLQSLTDEEYFDLTHRVRGGER